MAEAEDGDRGDAQAMRAGADADAKRVSYLDQALWRKLGEAETAEDFAQYWLALQCRMVVDVVRAQVVVGVGRSDEEPAVARWPEGDPGAEGLTIAAEQAVADRRGAIYGHRSGAGAQGGTCFTAYPFVFDDEVQGVVALEIEDRPEDILRAVMRELRWGAVWVELFYRRRWGRKTDQSQARSELTIDLIASAIADEGFEEACLGAATEMSTRLGCERVSIGFLRAGHAKVASVSHSARIGKRTNFIRAIGAAMDEAIDQRGPVMVPTGDDGGLQITTSHVDLMEAHGAGGVITVPFGDSERYSGAMTFELASLAEVDQTTVDQIECLACVVGPILDAKRREDRLVVVKVWESLTGQVQRLFGPHHYGRKLVATLLVVLLVLAGTLTDTYRVSADAVLEGAVRRAIVAPFDGYVLSEHARAGDRVKEGALLAALDINDLSLERLRRVSARAQRLAEYNQALAERESVQIDIIKAQIDQTDAEISLFDDQIARAELRAPFDGLIVSGDLSQSVGSSISRGEVLFEVGPLDAYRVVLLVDERRIADLEVGQRGTILLSALPDASFPIKVSGITPVSEARDGRNVFRVEAALERPPDRLRPGMAGVAKVEIGDRRLIWIWTHGLVEWIKVQAWTWWP